MGFAFDFPIPLHGPVFTKSLLGRDDVPNRGQCLHILHELAKLPPEQRALVIARMPIPARRALAEEWWWQVHGGQEEPKAGPDGAPWRVWAIVAGRGFGKTRAGAEWVWARAGRTGSARIALVAATIDEVERVMVAGESGLLACARGTSRRGGSPPRGYCDVPPARRRMPFRPSDRRNCAGRNIIMPGATSSPNGPGRKRRGAT